MQNYIQIYQERYRNQDNYALMIPVQNFKDQGLTRMIDDKNFNMVIRYFEIDDVLILLHFVKY